jgi:hypothetical protein
VPTENQVIILFFMFAYLIFLELIVNYKKFKFYIVIEKIFQQAKIEIYLLLTEQTDNEELKHLRCSRLSVVPSVGCTGAFILAK